MDATAPFGDVGHSSAAKEMLAEYRIGIIKMENVPATAPAPAPLPAIAAAGAVAATGAASTSEIAAAPLLPLATEEEDDSLLSKITAGVTGLFW